MNPTTTTPHKDLSPAVAAMSARKFRIPGDVVNKATVELPDEQRSAIRWLHDFGNSRDHSMDELGSLLKKDSGQAYSGASVYQTLTGRRGEAGASLEPFCKAVERLRKLEAARGRAQRAPFIETRLTKRIWTLCQAALNYQRIGFLYGDSQIGKSTALEEYQRQNNHGQTIYVRMPTRGTMESFIMVLAEKLRINPQLKTVILKQRIINAFDDRMLLIIDQCHEGFRSTYGDRGLSALLFTMEIFDLRKCGVILSGTGAFEKGMNDPKYAETMKQLIRRGFPKPLKLPSKPTADNLNDFANFYGLEPATGVALALQDQIIADHDLGIWLTTLQAGNNVASKKNEAMTWDHVIRANLGFLKMAGEGESK